MSRFLALPFALFFVTILFSACHKEHMPEQLPADTTAAPAAKLPIVYVAGDTMIGSTPYAMYWKDGISTEMPTGMNSYATSIYIDKGDVYVATQGTIYADSFRYWKNGVPVIVPDPRGFGHTTNALVVSNGIVYGTGSEHQRPDLTYVVTSWQNKDSALFLVPRETVVHNSRGSAIAVDNKDVYIAGTLDYTAVYWKNNILTHLYTDYPLAYNYSAARAICVNNGDVYVAGNVTVQSQSSPGQQGVAAYWKNNNLVKLTKDTASIGKAIAVVGDTVYVAGEIILSDAISRAVYWKNGIIHLLSSESSTANGIVIEGKDVYIVGTVNYEHAVYWKNEVPVSLGEGQANAIMVIKQ